MNRWRLFFLFAAIVKWGVGKERKEYCFCERGPLKLEKIAEIRTKTFYLSFWHLVKKTFNEKSFCITKQNIAVKYFDSFSWLFKMELNKVQKVYKIIAWCPHASISPSACSKSTAKKITCFFSEVFQFGTKAHASGSSQLPRLGWAAAM